MRFFGECLQVNQPQESLAGDAVGIEKFENSDLSFLVCHANLIEINAGLTHFIAILLHCTLSHVKPDSIVPNVADAQAFNRYSYARNNFLNCRIKHQGLPSVRMIFRLAATRFHSSIEPLGQRTSMRSTVSDFPSPKNNAMSF